MVQVNWKERIDLVNICYRIYLHLVSRQNSKSYPPSTERSRDKWLLPQSEQYIQLREDLRKGDRKKFNHWINNDDISQMLRVWCRIIRYHRKISIKTDVKVHSTILNLYIWYTIHCKLCFLPSSKLCTYVAVLILTKFQHGKGRIKFCPSAQNTCQTHNSFQTLSNG